MNNRVLLSVSEVSYSVGPKKNQTTNRNNVLSPNSHTPSRTAQTQATARFVTDGSMDLVAIVFRGRDNRYPGGVSAYGTSAASTQDRARDQKITGHVAWGLRKHYYLRWRLRKARSRWRRKARSRRRPVGRAARLTVCSAGPATPHQSGTPAVIPAHRCVGRELVRGAAPGHPRQRRLFTNQITPARRTEVSTQMERCVRMILHD